MKQGGIPIADQIAAVRMMVENMAATAPAYPKGAGEGDANG